MQVLIILNEPPYGNERSSMAEFTAWTLWADKVVTF